MRLIRVKVSKDVTTYFREKCAAVRLSDVNLFLDFYALAHLKGGGIPDATRTKALIAAYSKQLNIPQVILGPLIEKRRHVLIQVAQSPVFKAYLSARPTPHPRVVATQLIDHYIALHRAVRQAQCTTCQFLQGCNFGLQYGSAVSSIHAVRDPDYTKKIHPECPERPVLDAISFVAQAQEQLAQLAANPAQLQSVARQDPAAAALADTLPQAAEDAKADQEKRELDSDRSPASMPRVIDEADSEDEIDSAFTGGNLTEEVDDQVEWEASMMLTAQTGTPFIRLDAKRITEISMRSFMLFELSRKLTSKLVAKHQGKFKPSNEVTRHQKTTQIASVNDVTKILPKEHASDDDVFSAKLVKKDLVKRQHSTPETKRHLMYVLLDVSDSMNTCVGASVTLWSVVSRATLAASFTLALFELMKRENGIAFFRSFDGGLSDLRAARTADDFNIVSEHVARCMFNGSSTDIVGALTQACADISGAQHELRDAEILLITDCGAAISPASRAALTSKLGKTVLNVLDVASTKGGVETKAAIQLKEMADHYFEVDASASTLDKMVSLVGGKKKS